MGSLIALLQQGWQLGKREKELWAILCHQGSALNHPAPALGQVDAAWSSMGEWKVSLLTAGVGMRWGLRSLPNQTIL